MTQEQPELFSAQQRLRCLCPRRTAACYNGIITVQVGGSSALHPRLRVASSAIGHITRRLQSPNPAPSHHVSYNAPRYSRVHPLQHSGRKHMLEYHEQATCNDVKPIRGEEQSCRWSVVFSPSPWRLACPKSVYDLCVYSETVREKQRGAAPRHRSGT